MNNKGKIYALLSFLFGVTGTVLACIVLSSCSFYEVSYTDPPSGNSVTATPGLYVCKYADGNSPFLGPLNFMDGLAAAALFVGVISGVLSTLAIGSFYFRTKLRIKNPGASSCGFMLATFCHGVTYVVLVGAACDDYSEYKGSCKIMSNGYLNLGATGAWLIASCFSRSVVGASTGGGGGGGDGGGE